MLCCTATHIHLTLSASLDQPHCSVIDFHRRFYSAGVMRLVVVSRWAARVAASWVARVPASVGGSCRCLTLPTCFWVRR